MFPRIGHAVLSGDTAGTKSLHDESGVHRIV